MVDSYNAPTVDVITLVQESVILTGSDEEDTGGRGHGFIWDD